MTDPHTTASNDPNSQTPADWIDLSGKAALFLASDMSSFVTGIYLPVDGGWLVL